MAKAAPKSVVLKEIIEFAEYLGMDAMEDSDLLWIAEQARNAPLPAPWSEHQDEAGNTYYYNSATDDSVWEHPLDEYYRNLYRKHKAEKDDQAARDRAAEKDAELQGKRDGEKLAGKKKKAEKKLKRKTNAAITVQRHWRGRQGRRRMAEEVKRRAAVSFWAASKLQAVYRAKVARRVARERKLEVYATKIQANFRGLRLRKMVVARMTNLVSAITIQRHWRGYSVRREFIDQRRQIQRIRDWEEENEAAARIQQLFRFRLHQRRAEKARLSEEVDAITKLQRAIRKRNMWKNVSRLAAEYRQFNAGVVQEREDRDVLLQRIKNVEQMRDAKLARQQQEQRDRDNQAAAAASAQQHTAAAARTPAAAFAMPAGGTTIHMPLNKRERKLRARQELMVRMQVAAVVMVQRAFRRHMLRKRLHQLSLRNVVAAAKIQLAWRWHLSRVKKQEKFYIVRRLEVLMDSLTNSLHEREVVQRQLEAATLIQCHWRRFLAQELLLDMQEQHQAAMTLQRAMRGWLLRLWLSRARAAIRIQKHFRGFRVRVRVARARARDQARREKERNIREARQRREEQRRYEMQLQKEQEKLANERQEREALALEARERKRQERILNRAAVRCQANYRGFLTRRIVTPLLFEQRRLRIESERIRQEQAIDAAVALQAAWRGRNQRVSLVQERASIVIQKHWRGYLARSGPVMHERSALVIQRYFRGYYTRNYLAAYLEAKALSDAATRIQTTYRAHAVQRRVNRWNSLANSVQATFRGYLAREYAKKKRVDVYATKLQSVYRGYQGRQRANEYKQEGMHVAATRIQSMWRGRMCRMAILRDMYHWCSAFQIQRIWRKKLRKKIAAVTKLQSAWRAKNARHEMGQRQVHKFAILELRAQRRVSAIQIQRWFRVQYIRRMPLHAAATRLQSLWRGVLGRQVAARERFAFEQKYGNYKDFMLEMYSQARTAPADMEDDDGDDQPAQRAQASRASAPLTAAGRKKRREHNAKVSEELRENVNPFQMDARALERDLGVKMIWLKFDNETVNNMAYYFYKRSKPLAALQYLEKALWQDQRLQKRDFIAKTCLHFSTVLSRLGRHEEAFKLAEQAVILFQAEMGQVARSIIEEESRVTQVARMAAVGQATEDPAYVAAGSADSIRSLEAAISIGYHNMSVQQLCLGRSQEAQTTSSEALKYAKTSIESWHPWMKQAERTHLVSLQLDAAQAPDVPAEQQLMREPQQQSRRQQPRQQNSRRSSRQSSSRKQQPETQRRAWEEEAPSELQRSQAHGRPQAQSRENSRQPAFDRTNFD